MGIISSSSGSSCWRGLDYYKNKKIKDIKEISDIEYTSVVSGTKEYSVYLNLKNRYKFQRYINRYENIYISVLSYI